jgi:2-polyprenyl-3-methyl-5-hydroxy-6-metoxy-1,4-benzoquinol methylase
MFHVEQYTKHNECPICAEKELKGFLSCKDETVSKKMFQIEFCSACGFALTNPRPANESLGAFYESDEYISHSNTKKGLVSSLYQSVRKRTLKAKLRLLSTRSKQGLVLDIGCGTGEFLATCKESGWKTIGIEPSASARKQGQENFGLDVRDEQDLAGIENASAEAVTMWHVLEHVPDLHGRLKRIKEILKPNGVFIVAVPNRGSHDAAHYGANWAAYDVPRHLWHFRPQDITALMNRAGFEVKEILPMKFDSYYVSLLSEKYKNGRPRLLAAFWRGWISNRKAGSDKWSSQIYIIRHKN